MFRLAIECCALKMLVVISIFTGFRECLFCSIYYARRPNPKENAEKPKIILRPYSPLSKMPKRRYSYNIGIAFDLVKTNLVPSTRFAYRRIRKLTTKKTDCMKQKLYTYTSFLLNKTLVLFSCKI